MASTTESVTTRIVRSVADATDSDALELPPLYDAVDPDGLETLVEGMAEGAVAFTYADRTVTVRADGHVDVDEPAPEVGASTRTAVSD
ncbi:hypothetical protein G9C85_02270 [Halorubellus sp. JP-L1]|uniref:HalOD1 output domain-containing protein n=1 Tax=Halorubellus sp. JP-L1 TaxID=2715753 RepID=UPI00140A7CB7|nr:HalOD1 output domain-containing protein [Halorubellus sp. JP-L1]NHN40462.1 hypothetical protein [Halorubellus sp. JP-L1]